MSLRFRGETVPPGRMHQPPTTLVTSRAVSSPPQLYENLLEDLDAVHGPQRKFRRFRYLPFVVLVIAILFSGYWLSKQTLADSMDLTPPCQAFGNPNLIGPQGQRRNVTRLLRPLPRRWRDTLAGALSGKRSTPSKPVVERFRSQFQALDQHHNKWAIISSIQSASSDGWTGIQLSSTYGQSGFNLELECLQPSNVFVWLPWNLFCQTFQRRGKAQHEFIKYLSRVGEYPHGASAELDRWLTRLDKIDNLFLQPTLNDLYLLLSNVATTVGGSGRPRHYLQPMLQHIRNIEADCFVADGALHSLRSLIGAKRTAAKVFERYLVNRIATRLHLTHNLTSLSHLGEVTDLLKANDLRHKSRKEAAQVYWDTATQYIPSYVDIMKELHEVVLDDAAWSWTIDHFGHTLTSGPIPHNQTFHEAFLPDHTSVGCWHDSSPFLRWWYAEWSQGAILPADTPHWPDLFFSLTPADLDRKEKRHSFGILPDGTFGATKEKNEVVCCADRR